MAITIGFNSESMITFSSGRSSCTDKKSKRELKGKSIIALPSEYVVIDTETTGLDYQFCDLIEVSAIRYSSGVPLETFSSLIQPPPYEVDDELDTCYTEYVNEFITQLTGITNEMLADAPKSESVIPSLLDFLGNSILIGHNVNFDVNFLYDAAERCGKHLTNDFIDTLRISRKVFPELKHHRLSDIVEACHVQPEGEHRSEYDCHTTAQCYEAMRQKILEKGSEHDFQKLFTSHRTYPDRHALENITATVDSIDDTNPLFGKVVVFTGVLSAMERKDAFQLVVNLGGIPKDSITKKTNYLVIGCTDFISSVKNGKTNKMKLADTYRQKGLEITTISESAFFDMISDYI